jgi:hypothetical protein
MKLIGFILVLLNTPFLFAQNSIEDTILSVTDKVYIKAPKNTKVLRYYAKNALSSSLIKSESTIFTYNDLSWETDSVFVEIQAIYSGTTTSLRNYTRSIEKDSTLTEIERCSLVADKINNNYNTLLRKITNDYGLNYQATKMRGLYYYSDAVGILVERERVIKKFLFIPFYKKVYKTQSYMERHIFVDSVVYCLSVYAKHKGNRIKVVRPQNRMKSISKIQPSFDRLVNSLIIKEEENQVLIKKEE